MTMRLLLAGLLASTALGLGLVAWQAARPTTTVISAAPPEATPPPLTVNVLVVAHPVPAGTLIKDADLVGKAMPAAQVQSDDLLDRPDVRVGLRGALLRRWLDAGDRIGPGDVLRPRDRGFLAAVLTPGTRAIAIGVDAVTGTGGLIWPGDRVDVLLTQELDGKETPLAHRVVGETVLQNVRVVAVDQSITQGAATDSAAGKPARTVTLEVTPDQAAHAAVAQQLGKLTLTLCAAEESGPGPRGPETVYGADVSHALGGPPTVTPAARMRVIQGTENREFTFR